LKDLKNNFKYLKISHAFIEDITYVIDKYNDLLNDKNLEENSKLLEKYVNEVTLWKK